MQNAVLVFISLFDNCRTLPGEGRILHRLRTDWSMSSTLYKWVIDQVHRGNLNVLHVSGDEMVADGLIKPLKKINHAKFVKMLGLSSPAPETRK
jgi:hypothetical protein